MTLVSDAKQIAREYGQRPTEFALRYLRMCGYLMRGRMTDEYCIKVNYLPRKDNWHFDDRANKDEYQDRIYASIKNFFVDRGLASAVDVGCGSGFKLLKYFAEFRTVGLELPPAIDWLRETYPERDWRLSNWETPLQDAVDMAISVDVIEHLRDPDRLMHFLTETKASYFALGTPDRNHLDAKSRVGPPRNRAHIREWSQNEFVDYVGRYFRVLRSEVVSSHEHYVIAERSLAGVRDRTHVHAGRAHL